MTTPKSRDRENRRETAREKTLDITGRTARMLLADKRVNKMALNRNRTEVAVMLHAGWSFATDRHEPCRTFTLWEAARNAVRRAVQVS